MLHVMMLLGVSHCRLHIKASTASVVFIIASGVDNAASPDWQTIAEWDFISPQREADHYAKTTEGTQKYINEQCR